MQEKIYKIKIHHVDELRDQIKKAWDEINQRIIVDSIKQWRARLRACIAVKGGHFEHQL